MTATAPARQYPFIARTPSSLADSDLSTRQTVGLMTEYIRRTLADPVFQKLARELRARWSLGPQRLHTAWQIYWYVKHRIRHTNHEKVLWALGEQDQVDFIIEPRVLIRQTNPEGDCKEFTMMICALLEANGIPAEIQTVAADPTRPGVWSHVYAVAHMEDGCRLPLDASRAGQYPGWEVPRRDVMRAQSWDMQGRPVSGELVGSQDLMMHGYVRTRRRGIGQTDVQLVPVEDAAGNTTWVSVDPASGAGTVIPENAPIVGPGAPPGSGFNANALISMLGSIGSKLATLGLTPRGAYVLPNGTVVNAVPGAVPPSPGATFTLGGMSGTTLLIAGVAVVGLIALFGSRHR